MLFSAPGVPHGEVPPVEKRGPTSPQPALAAVFGARGMWLMGKRYRIGQEKASG